MSMPHDFVSQKEYLKKYLPGDDSKKKKKKKISTNKVKRSKIIDDDIDYKSMRPLDDDEVELYQMDEDAPQIAGIIDERPPEVKAQEQYNSKRWKVFGGDDGVNIIDGMANAQPSVSAKLSAACKEFDKNRKFENEGSSSRMNYAPKRETVLDETRNKINTKSKLKTSGSESDDLSTTKYKTSRTKNMSSDSDESLPRGKKQRSLHRDNSYQSPPQNEKNNSGRYKYDSDPSPPRKDRTIKTIQYQSDSDASPPRRESRKKIQKHSERPPPVKEPKIRRRSDSDSSPPRKDIGKRSKNKSDSDKSPHNVRKSTFKHKQECYKTSPKRTRRQSSSESDSSPPRRDRRRSPRRKTLSENKRKRSSRSSTPPPKTILLNKTLPLSKSNKNISPRLSRRDLMNEKNVKRHFSDSDDSPPRRRRNSFRHDGSASDLSPPRKLPSLKKDKPIKKALYKPNECSSSEESSRSKSKKMKTTLDGKQAGLQDAKDLRRELSDLKMKEDLMFSKMEASVSGAGAAPIKRDRKTGQVRDPEKEKEALKEKEAKDSVVKEKYYKWGKGLKQVEDAAERAAEVMKEMNKPLARYADDTDLDNFLKAQDREGDPMLDYIRQKQSEATPLVGVKPIYKGSYHPNRFNIRPGHRWDGVVRSNGYEKEWFTHQNARKARDEEAFKWSTSDM